MKFARLGYHDFFAAVSPGFLDKNVYPKLGGKSTQLEPVRATCKIATGQRKRYSEKVITPSASLLHITKHFAQGETKIPVKLDLLRSCSK